MQRGFFHDEEADPEQYIFGSGALGGEILQEDRDWRPYMPEELQNDRGYDPLDCASINTERPIRALIKRKYGIDTQYSERWLAWATGTKDKGGNDPHYVAEFLRKNGMPLESDWPSDVSQEHFYDTPPASLTQKAKDFVNEWDFGHDTVRGGPEAIWTALQFSPVAVSVGWNSIDENGYWYKAGNGPDTHWSVTVWGGEYRKYFLFSDSAEPVIKKVAWDKLNPQLAKRYSISLRLTDDQKQKLSWMQAALQWILTQLPFLKASQSPEKPLQNDVAPKLDETPVKPREPLLTAFCKAIEMYEGYAPGTRAYRNKNPGNVRYGPFAKSCGATGADDKNFAIFPTYDVGFAALLMLVTRAATGKSTIYKPEMTLTQFFKVYAPSSDNNNPDAYAKFVAKRLGVEVSLQINNLVA